MQPQKGKTRKSVLVPAALGAGLAAGALSTALVAEFSSRARSQDERECARAVVQDHDKMAEFVGREQYYRDPVVQENFSADFCACMWEKHSPDYACKGVKFTFK